MLGSGAESSHLVFRQLSCARFDLEIHRGMAVHGWERLKVLHLLITGLQHSRATCPICAVPAVNLLPRGCRGVREASCTLCLATVQDNMKKLV